MNLLLVTGVVTGVFFVGSLLQFMVRQRELGMGAIFAVLPHLLPALFTWTLPSSLLLATIMTFGRMGEDSEVTALRACGVPLYHVLLPAVFVGVALSGLCFYLNSEVVPHSLERQRDIGRDVLRRFKSLLEESRGNSYVFSKFKMSWERVDDNGDLIGLEIVHSPDGSDSREMVNIHADKGNIDVSADEAYLLFDLTGVVLTRYDADGRPTPADRAGSFEMSVRSTEFSKRKSHRKTSELTLGEVAYAIQRGGQRRFRPTRLKTEFHTRLVLSLAPLVMVIVGAPIGVLLGRSGVVTAFAVAFLTAGVPYYVILLVMRAMASDAKISAVWIWSANGAMILLGALLTRKAVRG